jgi:hypothetical protein
MFRLLRRLKGKNTRGNNTRGNNTRGNNMTLIHFKNIQRFSNKETDKETESVSSGLFSIGDVCYYCNGFKIIKCLECNGQGKYMEDGMKEYICKGCYGHGNNFCVFCAGTGTNFLL